MRPRIACFSNDASGGRGGEQPLSKLLGNKTYVCVVLKNPLPSFRPNDFADNMNDKAFYIKSRKHLHPNGM